MSALLLWQSERETEKADNVNIWRLVHNDSLLRKRNATTTDSFPRQRVQVI